MRKVIKQSGKYYSQETSVGAEITAEGIQERLVEMQAEKTRALEQVTTSYDRRIAELESNLAEINVLVAAAQ